MSESKNPIYDDERKVRLLEWLTTIPSERKPSTKAALAEELGVSPRTLRDWQARDDFHREWEKRAREVAGDPEKMQAVLQAMFEAATDRDAKDRVSAAKTWLEANGAIRPPQREEEQGGGNLQTISNEKLEELIAAAAQRELEQRSPKGPQLTVVPGNG